MGRRSRQRGGPAAPGSARPSAGDGSSSRPSVAAPPPPSTPRRRSRLEDAPTPPWHPVPLVEIAVLAGIVALVVGFTSDGTQQRNLILAGVLLCSLGGLEVTLREHLSGFRSHTVVLALALGLLVGIPVGVLAGSRIVGAGVIVATVLLAGFALRRQFARRAGGLTWRA